MSDNDDPPREDPADPPQPPKPISRRACAVIFDEIIPSSIPACVFEDLLGSHAPLVLNVVFLRRHRKPRTRRERRRWRTTWSGA